jgi:hypothetical protein
MATVLPRRMKLVHQILPIVFLENVPNGVAANRIIQQATHGQNYGRKAGRIISKRLQLKKK